ncbi:MAG: M23 family metallopeptidase [Candidatus Hydrogenedentota bacterium]
MSSRWKIKKRFTFVIVTPDSKRMFSLKISKNLLYASLLGVLVLFIIPILSSLSHIKDVIHFMDITYKQQKEINNQSQKIDVYETLLSKLHRYAFSSSKDDVTKNIGGFPLDNKVNNVIAGSVDGNDLIIKSINKGSVDQDLLKLEEFYRELTNIFKATPIGWPIDLSTSYYISSPFGYRINPFTYLLEFHEGIDIVAPYKSKIFATADGAVTFADRKIGFGNCVVIKHRFNYETMYGHLYKIKVKDGQKVKRGDVIGLLGNSGLSTGPHLHYEISINKTKVDPWKYLIKDIR